MVKLLSSVTNHNSYESFSAHISIWRTHKALTECSSVLGFSFLATDDETAEKAVEVSSESGSAQRWCFIDMAGDIKSVIFIMFYRG